MFNNMENLEFNSIPSFQLIILFFVILGIFFMIFLLPKLTKQKLVNKNEHGSAKFAGIKEIKSVFSKEKIEKPNVAGFPVFYEKKNRKFKYVYFDKSSAHFLTIGSTGSGKSVGVVIPSCILFANAKEKHSVVVTDPKAEIFEKTGRIFSDNGYEVITLDFRNPSKSKRINLMQPIISEWQLHCEYNKIMLNLLAYYLKLNKIDIETIQKGENITKDLEKLKVTDQYLKEIIKNNINKLPIGEGFFNDDVLLEKFLKDKNIDVKEIKNNKNCKEIEELLIQAHNFSLKHQAEANRFVISLSNLIFTDNNANDKFWINSAKNLFIGIVGIFLEDYKLGLIDEKKINVSSIKKFQNSTLTKVNQSYMQQNLSSREYGDLSKDYLTSIFSAAENTYKSITTVFAEKMAIFDDLNVEHITSANDFNFIDLGTKPIALFIIVPDEEQSYYQLVTLIVGMLIKDLTRFANLPQNGGVLPYKVEWILDEFANCPAIDSIETTVSVARARGMRFFFFIQSFSQLERIYGKDVSKIIVDNCALVYLKTNNVETAEVISRKLGKTTIETQSINQSTNPMKIGANQTSSLMGKDLLSVTEIMSLKHKIIIFSTISNPIFSNTHLYSNLFPKFKNISKLERQTCALKRDVKNYYTIDEMKKNYTKSYNDGLNEVNKKRLLFNNKNDLYNNKMCISSNDNISNSNLLILFEMVNKMFHNRSATCLKKTENYFIFKINGLLNSFEISKLKKMLNKHCAIIIAKNNQLKETILYILEN